MGKFVAYILLLGSIAVGIAYYSLRPRPLPPAPSAAKAASADDTSWLADLYSQNPRDTARGTAKVNELGVRALPQIQATLRDPGAEHNHRRAALRASAILGVAATPALADVAAALPDADLTADAAVALSFMGPAALPPLRKALSSEDPVVRREALRSIGKLRFRAPLAPDDVLTLVLDAMPDPDEGVRAVAATYLGILHDDAGASVPLLVQALEDPDPAVRRAAATALGSFGADAASAIQALRKAAGGPDPDMAREAGRSIVAISGGK